MTKQGKKAEKKKNIYLVLKAMGFENVPDKPGEFLFVSPHLAESQKSEISDATSNISLFSRPQPWRIARWHLSAQDNSFVTHSLKLILDLQVLRNLMIEAIKQDYKASLLFDWVVSLEECGGWLLTEFVADAQVDRSVAGFRCSFYARKHKFAIGITDAFYLGNLPQGFLPSAMNIIKSAISYQPLQDESNCFESAFSLIQLAAQALIKDEDDFATYFPLMNASANAEDLVASDPVMAEGQWVFSLNDKAHVQREARPTKLRRVGIEILEAREMHKRYEDIELCMQRKQVDEAARKICLNIASTPDNLYLFRRLSLLAHALPVEQGVERMAEVLKLEPESLLFLSYLTKLLLDTGRYKEALPHVSKLGELLFRAIRNPEELQCLAYVLPTILGDCWFEEDPERAKACYQRVLAKRGEMPSILDRIARLAKVTGNVKEETKFLERLASSETDDNSASEIFYRLLVAKAANPQERDTAVRHGMECLRRNPLNVSAALITAALMIEQREHDLALEVLNNTLESISAIGSNASDVANLECEIGSIWLEKFHRHDLAKLHFERATSADPFHIKSLKKLEEVLRKQNDVHGLIKNLHAQIICGKREKNVVEINQKRREIVRLYSETLKDVGRAFQIYLQWDEDFVIESDEIEQFLKWPGERGDWKSLYAKVVSYIKKQPIDKNTAEMYANLAHICRHKLNDDVKAVEHLRQAIRVGWLEKADFDYLTAQLRAKDNRKALMECLKIRIEQVPDGEKVPLIKELLSYGGTLDDKDKDQYALTLYRFDPDEKKELFKRLNEYKLAGDLAGIERLAEALLISTEGEMKSYFWLELIIDTLGTLKNDNAYPLLDKFLKLKIRQNGNDVQTLESAVEMFSQSAPQAFLKYYVEELLNVGVLPKIVFPQLIKLLEDESLSMGKLYFLQAEKEKDQALAAKLAKKASSIFAKHASERLLEERSFGVYCSLVQCLPGEIAHLRDLVNHSNNWLFFIRVLQKQVEFTEEREWLLSLWQEIAEVYKDRLNNPQKALEALEKTIPLVKDATAVQLQILGILHDLGDKEQEYRLLLRYFEDENFVRNTDTMRQFLERLQSLFKDATATGEIFSKHIKNFTDKGEDDIAQRLSAILLEKNLLNDDLKKLAFKQILQQGDLAKVSHAWIAMLESMANVDEAVAFFDWTRDLFEDLRVDLKFEQLLVEATKKINWQKIPDPCASELKTILGLELFHSDKQRSIAEELLRAVVASGKMDPRVLMPLYLLTREQGKDQDTLRYLADIIPLAKANPGLIKSFPVTFESLSMEYSKLRSRYPNFEAEIEDTANMPLASGFSNSPSTASYQVKVTTPAEVERDALDPSSNLTRGVLDWRRLVKDLSISTGMTNSLFNQPFSSAIEKHVALQVVALLTGECKALERWHWQVWRHPDQLGYRLSGRERYPEEITNAALHSPLHKLVLTLSAVFVRAYKSSFTHSYLARHLNISQKNLVHYVKPLAETDWLFEKTGMKNYFEMIKRQRFVFFDTAGLKQDIFYDGSSRSFFLDQKFYAKFPASIAFYRLFGLMWSVKLNYYVPLRLDPVKQLYPALVAIRQNLSSMGLGRIRAFFGIEERGRMGRAMANVDRSEIQQLLQRVGAFNEKDLQRLCFAMNEHIYRLLIAETLDVIGIFESIVGKDLIRAELTPKQILNLSPYFPGLLKFIAALKI